MTIKIKKYPLGSEIPQPIEKDTWKRVDDETIRRGRSPHSRNGLDKYGLPVRMPGECDEPASPLLKDIFKEARDDVVKKV